MKRNLIAEKSLVFAINSVQYYKELKKLNIEVMPRQFLRSATSVGANIQEAKGASSDRDFLMKLSIARKEAYESQYWLILLEKMNTPMVEDQKRLFAQAEELIRMLTAATRTLEIKLGRK
jgi:four helix bundle protein